MNHGRVGILSFAVGMLCAFSVQANPREAEQAGRRAMSEGRFFAAIEHFDQALNQNPRYLDALLGTAEAYLELNEPEVAIGFLEQAATPAGDRPAYLLLRARAELLSGRPAQAEVLYQRVLTREPNNVDARLGRAELQLAGGNALEARRIYEDILRVAPQSRRGLLSLALLHDNQGNREASERYLLTALQYHRENPQVHYLAGEYYRAQGLLARAERHASTAVALHPEYQEALALLARVFFEQERGIEARETAQQVISLNRENSDAWYLVARAEYYLGDVDAALDALETAVRISPDREVIRMAREHMLLHDLPLEDPRRAEAALYHFQRAREFASRNYNHRASVAFRTGLQLDPYNHQARNEYADLFRLAGNTGRYLQELFVLRDLGDTRTEVADRIETFSHLNVDSVAQRWNLSQFEIPRDRMEIALFTVVDQNRLELPLTDELLTDSLRRHMLRYEQVAVQGNPYIVTGLGDAYSQARSSGTDYFALVRFEEYDRNFSTYLVLYHAGTGTEVARFSAQRAGNDRVLEAHRTISVRLSESLPLRGRLLERRFERGLINLGKLDGVEEGMEFAILRAGSADLSPQALRHRYPEDAVLGRFIVSEADDLVSEGRVARDGFFDLINRGDTVLSPPKEFPEPPVQEPRPEGLLQRIRSLLP